MAHRTITSPSACLVQPYEPGLVIDGRDPPPSGEGDQLRSELRQALFTCPDDLQAILRIAEDHLLRLHVVQVRGELERGFRVLSQADLPAALTRTAERLCQEHGATVRQQLTSVLESVGVLERPPHHPHVVVHHCPGEQTELLTDGTHYGYVIEGTSVDATPTLELHHDGCSYPLYEESYFCAPGESTIRGEGTVLIATRLGVHGLFSLGGRLERSGRLRYIDGCTATTLIPPVRKGDPCLHALYIPGGVHQTPHRHPSVRVVVVVGGGGTCQTPQGTLPLRQGDTVYLPPEALHSFHTAAQRGRDPSLTVVTFHPDSDAGPTDEEHTMRNRTYVTFEDRLRSAMRLQEG